MKATIRPAAAAAAVIVLAAAALAASETLRSNLYINGALASSRVIQSQGIAYVPVADVAKALNQVVVVKSDGYAIAQAGGANQVGGLNGKIGDKLTNGQMTVAVVSVTRGDHYVRTLSSGTEDTREPTDDLVAVKVRIKNATSKSVWMVDAGGDFTSLTDTDEHAYKPRFTDAVSFDPTLLPGSATDFVLIYEIPKNEKLGDYVYQLSASQVKSSTFRIALDSANH